jgi:hypothetical protein
VVLVNDVPALWAARVTRYPGSARPVAAISVWAATNTSCGPTKSRLCTPGYKTMSTFLGFRARFVMRSIMAHPALVRKDRFPTISAIADRAARANAAASDARV